MIKCIGKKVACEILATDSKRGSFWLPESAKENRGYGKVVAVGSKVLDVEPGDIVVLSKFSGTDTEIDGVRHAFIDESDILAKMEKGSKK